MLLPQNYSAENVQLRMGNTFFAFVTQHTRVCIVKFFFASTKYKKFFWLVFEPRSKTNAIKFGATKRNVTDYKGVQLG